MRKSEFAIWIVLVALVASQPACYTSCAKEGCLATNSLACTRCNPGTSLISQRCTPIDSQSEPIQFLTPVSQTQLDTASIANYANRPQIQCGYFSLGQTGVITLLNVTVTKSLVYTFRVPLVSIRSPHQYISLKFNAVLFNQNNNPLLRLLIIDDANKHILDTQITPNETEYQCNISNRFVSSSRAFYVDRSVSSQSSQLLISVSTLQPGDELGISNINIYYGNCYIGCRTCQGPSATQCLTCQNLLTYNPTQMSCLACPSKFYKVNQMCYPCPYNCSECTYNQTTGSPICTQCQSRISAGTAPSCQVNNLIIAELSGIKFNETSGWQSTAVLSNLITTCGSYSLVGGLPLGFGGSALFKSFTNLPVHSEIWIKFTLMMIDQVTGSTFTLFVTVNGVQVLNSTIIIDSAVMNTNECGTSNQEFVQNIFIRNVKHTSTNASVQILGISNYYGIRDFVLGVVNTTNQTKCQQANEQNVCIRCRNGFMLNSPPDINNPNIALEPCTVCPEGYYNADGFCRPCSIYCRTCTGNSSYNKCTACNAPLQFNLQTGTCNDVNKNLYTVLLSRQWPNLTENNWQFYPKLQNKGMDKCGTEYIIGSTQIRYRELKMSKTFANLPNHQGVYLHFFFYQIDDYDGIANSNNFNSVSFNINGLNIPYNISRYGFDMCGNSSYDSVNKVILSDPSHTANSLTFQVNGVGTKFGISNILVFLSNCQDCSGGISYELQVIPQYSVDSIPDPTTKGMKSKLIFSEKVQTSIDPLHLFRVVLMNSSSVNATQLQQINGGDYAKGQKDQYAILAAQLYKNRQLRLFQNLIKDQYWKTAVATLQYPDSIYGLDYNSQNIMKNLQLSPAFANFSRYDDIYSILDADPNSNGPQYRANTRNLMNLFRGISILALFIGLISFFFGLSQLFDDLFILCQLIFVHIFIQSPWIAATLKLPLGAMNLVQFMAWLPIQGRNAIESGIIPSNHYQRSPIVYEQFWKDISFARAIYHTVIFLVAMLAMYWLIRLIQALRQPSINQVTQITQKRYHYIENHYYSYIKRWFVFLDKVMRFTFFTVVWAANLQFIHFYCQPREFMGWNSTLCIVMFVVYVAYIFLGWFYLRKKGQITQALTFKEKFDGIRIRVERLWYFIFRYFKLLIIAILISQLYAVNPLAVLIPLLFIHLLDAFVIFFLKPFLLDAGESERIVSNCSRRYWTYYRYSHVIENLLFFILEIIMIIMFGVRSKNDNKDSYLSIGYAGVAFIIMLLINGLVRLVWGFIRIFELCSDDLKSREQQIQSEEDIGPLQYLNFVRNIQNNEMFTTDRNNDRRPSIDIKVR